MTLRIRTILRDIHSLQRGLAQRNPTTVLAAAQALQRGLATPLPGHLSHLIQTPLGHSASTLELLRQGQALPASHPDFAQNMLRTAHVCERLTPALNPLIPLEDQPIIQDAQALERVVNHNDPQVHPYFVGLAADHAPLITIGGIRQRLGHLPVGSGAPLLVQSAMALVIEDLDTLNVLQIGLRNEPVPAPLQLIVSALELRAATGEPEPSNPQHARATLLEDLGLLVGRGRDYGEAFDRIEVEQMEPDSTQAIVHLAEEIDADLVRTTMPTARKAALARLTHQVNHPDGQVRLLIADLMARLVMRPMGETDGVAYYDPLVTLARDAVLPVRLSAMRGVLSLPKRADASHREVMLDIPYFETITAVLANPLLYEHLRALAFLDDTWVSLSLEEKIRLAQTLTQVIDPLTGPNGLPLPADTLARQRHYCTAIFAIGFLVRRRQNLDERFWAHLANRADIVLILAWGEDHLRDDMGSFWKVAHQEAIAAAHVLGYDTPSGAFN